jgi:hypothetical protein
MNEVKVYGIRDFYELFNQEFLNSQNMSKVDLIILL